MVGGRAACLTRSGEKRTRTDWDEAGGRGELRYVSTGNGYVRCMPGTGRLRQDATDDSAARVERKGRLLRWLFRRPSRVGQAKRREADEVPGCVDLDDERPKQRAERP